MERKDFALGQPVVLDVLFTVAELPTNPTTITMTILAPDEGTITYEWPGAAQFANTGPGAFTFTFTPSMLGVHAYRWLGSGDAAGAFEGDFLVQSLITGPLDIINHPSEYDGIRLLLGVTTLDVPDSVIDSSPYGPIAESMVKLEVDDYQALVADLALPTPQPISTLRWQFLVGATQYLTASLIANTYARGGMVGLVRGEGQRTPEQWARYATELWTIGQGYLDNGKISSEEDLEALMASLSAHPWLYITGPSRSRKDDPWALYTSGWWTGWRGTVES